MAAVRDGLPDGRYGRTADERADRKLKVIGAVLGAALVAMVAWFGISYITEQDLSGRLVTYKVVSDTTVQAHLEVVKDTGAKGVCTLRSQSADGAEVGRKDVPVDQAKSQVDTVITIRTTARATNAELVGCTTSDALGASS
ncbi:DUF4307 domain-containing protein [Streptomyces purpurogeneiscleroticus]|uniref:DUF4307 domain-containing protein n=1 Tax=Streptomyces purpurogeneiscleroticus TaxID=68259 RepID=UPI001CBDF386|nr:DUF4307 domain-containing protein [Streptomyces purpurogeneiscleroticus]MBZ4017242.1 hypothetical protein [Streptomyces purpurogeneiscleroticus]